MTGAESEDVMLVGGGGEQCIISKLLLSAVSPLVHELLKDQGFCSGCPVRTTILIPWADDDVLRELINALKSSKDCFDGLILNSISIRLQELARHLGIKTRFKDPRPSTTSAGGTKFKQEVLTSGDGPAAQANNSNSSIVQDRQSSGLLKRKSSFNDESLSSKYQPCVKIQRLDLCEIESIEEKTYLVTNEEEREQHEPPPRQTKPTMHHPTTATEETDMNTRSTEKTAVAQLYNCHLCQAEFKLRKSLYEHYSLSHFKQELLTIGRNTSARSCHICGKHFKLEYKKIRHLGVTHDLVDYFLEEKHQIAKKFNRPIDMSDPSDKKFPCGLCNSAFDKERYLLAHYISKHFSHKIDETYGEFQGTEQVCPICGTLVTGDKHKWRKHLGLTHRLVFDYLKKEPRLKRQALKKGAAVKKEQAAKKWGKSGSASGGNNKGPESQQKCSKLCKTLTESSISDRLPRLEIDHEDNKNDVLKYAETLVDNKSFTKAPAVIIKQEDTVREAQMAHVLAKKIKQEAQDSEPDDFSSHCETSIDITDNMEAFGDTIPCDDINTGFSNNQKHLSTHIFNTETAPTSFSVTDAQPISQAAKDKGCTSGVENLSIVNARSDSTPANEDYQLWDDSPPDSPEIATANTFYIC